MESKIKGLQEFLKDNIVGYDQVWFNRKGEFLYSEGQGFDFVYSRDEILADGFESKLEKEIEKKGKEEAKFAKDQAATYEALAQNNEAIQATNEAIETKSANTSKNNK